MLGVEGGSREAPASIGLPILMYYSVNVSTTYISRPHGHPRPWPLVLARSPRKVTLWGVGPFVVVQEVTPG